MPNNRPKNVILRDATVRYLNFRGEANRFNAEGKRNFVVVLEPEEAEDLIAAGWNVRTRLPREEGGEPLMTLAVAVSFKGRPARIIMIGSETKKRTPLTEETVGLLDYARLKCVDLHLTPYVWEVGDKRGVKAYLESAYITIQEDPLDVAYAEILQEDAAEIFDEGAPF